MMTPWASDAALKAHQRMAKLPSRQHCLLGVDRVAMERMGIQFRSLAAPTIRERVVEACLRLGGKATISVLAKATSIERSSVHRAVEGLVNRGLMVRAFSVPRPGTTGGTEGVYRVVGYWDE